MKRALVLSLIFAVGLGFAGFAQTLSGTWDTDIILDLTATAWPAGVAINSEITVDYTVGDWTFGSVTTIDDTGWLDQTFSAGGVLGAFSLTSALDLDPAGLFDEWVTTAAVSIAGVSFGAEFTLDGLDAYLTLTANVTSRSRTSRSTLDSRSAAPTSLPASTSRALASRRSALRSAALRCRTFRG
jgi:hypothetical protein